MVEERQRSVVMSCGEMGSDESVVDELGLPARREQCVGDEQNRVDLFDLV